MKLGAIYSKEKTTFTLFSPVADSVFVIFYDKGNDSAEKGRLEMMRGEGELRSIFSATAEGNLDGVYYTYEVHTSDGTFSSHDPYARACGVNGHGLWLLTCQRLILMDLQMRTGQSLQTP